MRKTTWALLFFSVPSLWAQNFSYPFDGYDRAQVFYQNKDYANAWNAWELSSKATYSPFLEEKSYKILSASLRLNTPGTEKKLKTFLLDFPSSWYGVSIPFDLANYYFDNGKYSYALKWFRKVKERDVAKPMLPQYYFKKGYTEFLTKRYKSAQGLLEKVKNNPEFESDAHYYLGHIAYQLEDYDGASQSFGKVSNPNQKNDLGYFKVDMNFKLGRFEEAIKLGEAELSQSSNNQSELSKIVGESYFNLKAYEKALPYLLQYEGKNKKWSNVDYYQLGYTHYHLKQYEEGVAQFNKIVGKKDALAQNAYYFLGHCYLQINKPTAARNAFRSASQMTFDPKVNEDALFQYAKLSYQLGNPYEAPQEVLNRFKEQYPDHPEQELIAGLLIDSYTTLGNYKAAIQMLTNGTLFKDNETLQKVLFLQGYKSFQQGNYREATTYFEKASAKDADRMLSVRAIFWNAQAHYQFNDFEQAIDLFDDFESASQAPQLAEWNTFYYNQGYAYFKLKRYTEAIQAFEKQATQSQSLSRSVKRDLYLRLGDAYFAEKKYWPAMENYNKSIKLNAAKGSYALYQKAISYGFVGRNPQKIENLEQLIASKTKHKLIDDALYALASTQAGQGNNSAALDNYDRLLKAYPKSPYNSRALLNKGLILYNQEKLAEATAIMRRLVSLYPKSAVAQQALNTLREIAVESGTVTNFSRWLRDNRIQQFDSSELEQTAFDAAEKKFLDNKKKQAEKLLNEYLEEHSSGANSLAANFYLGEIYFEEAQWESAVTAYEKVIDTDNEYLEKALVRSAMALVNGEKMEKAIPIWKRLDSLANFEENKRYAVFNLMKAYFDTGNYSAAVAQSEKVLQLPEISAKVKWDAYDILAHAALAQKDTVRARKAFTALEKAPKDALAAEALFFKAYLQNREKDYEKSNTTIAQIAKQYSSAGDWSAKSLFLMAQNFQRLDDAFQALFILESLIENFKQYPEIITQAMDLKSQIEKKEAEKNESVKANENKQ